MQWCQSLASGAFFERPTLLLTPNHDGAAVDGRASPRSARSANQVVPQTHGVQRKQQQGASCGATCRKAKTNWLFIVDPHANELLSGSIRHCQRFRRLQSRLRVHPSRRSTLQDFQNILPASFECRQILLPSACDVEIRRNSPTCHPYLTRTARNMRTQYCDRTRAGARSELCHTSVAPLRDTAELSHDADLFCCLVACTLTSRDADAPPEHPSPIFSQASDPPVPPRRCVARLSGRRVEASTLLALDAESRALVLNKSEPLYRRIKKGFL
jgi:hypothetical protein